MQIVSMTQEEQQPLQSSMLVQHSYFTSMPDLHSLVDTQHFARPVSTLPPSGISTPAIPLPLPPYDWSTEKNVPPSTESVTSTSPLSQEAPARLGSPSCLHFPSTLRARSRTLEDDVFCVLDPFSPMTRLVEGTLLPQLVTRCNAGMRAGVRPFLAEGAMGGAYFLRDAKRKICVVFKPSDEEPMAPNNPYQSFGRYGTAYKGQIVPGFGMFRELAAFIIDDGLAGVPPTGVAKAKHEVFARNDKGRSTHKIGSIQAYVRNECSAEEMGPSMFNASSVQRIAILDIRLCNQDRHPGNLLVCKEPQFRADTSAAIGLDQACTASLSPPFPVKPIPHIFTFDSSDKAMSSNPPPPLHPSSSPSFSLSPPSCIECPRKRPPPLASPLGSPEHPRVFQRLSSTPASTLLASVGCGSTSEDTGPSSSSSSPSPSHSKPDYFLAPIDHGYCFPHVLHMGEACFAWQGWPQVCKPVEPSLREVISNLDADAEVTKILQATGAAIAPPSLLSLRVCTYLLKTAVLKANWTLDQVAAAITRNGREAAQFSALEMIVSSAMAKLRDSAPLTYTTRSMGVSVGARSPRQMRTVEDDRLLVQHSDLFMSYVAQGIDQFVLG